LPDYNVHKNNDKYQLNFDKTKLTGCDTGEMAQTLGIGLSFKKNKTDIPNYLVKKL